MLSCGYDIIILSIDLISLHAIESIEKKVLIFAMPKMTLERIVSSLFVLPYLDLNRFISY